MKLTVEFELDDSWEAYYTNNNDRLRDIIKWGLEGVKTAVIEHLELRQDLELDGVLYLSGTVKTEKEWCDITGALSLIPLSESDIKYFREV